MINLTQCGGTFRTARSGIVSYSRQILQHRIPTRGIRLACLTRPCESLHWTGEPRSAFRPCRGQGEASPLCECADRASSYNANRTNIDTAPHAPPPLPDLPPVDAPSAGFVVQLFVIPAVVVAVVILVWLLFGKLAGGERDPAEYVRRLRQASGDWRSAFELASLIQNDAKLASEPRLLGELTDLLSAELKANANAELIVYLIKTIGAFQTLDATLDDGRKVDPIEPLRGARAEYDLAIRMEAAASLAKHAARMEGKLDDPRAVAA